MPAIAGVLDLPSIPNFQGWTIRREEIQILETLGQGGYGKVHKARLFGTDIVAVKELNDPTPAHEERFRQEVAILSSLRSPYIVQFLGASLTQGSAMLLTEFCERGDLYQAIKRDQGTGMLSWYRRGKHLALDIAKGLFFMHRNHIIHFDIKSPNILLTSTLQAKIADVGIAKHSTRSSTDVEGGIGSFDWVSPEQIMLENCTAKADVFSFGVVLWEIVTGERPRRGQNSPPEVPRQCPAIIAQLIEQCQARDPKERPTAAEVLHHLVCLQEQEDAARGTPPPPSNYICPITQALMVDPVLLVQTSIAYERTSIRKWLTDGHRQCPATGLPISPPFVLVSDASLQKAIQRWSANNPSANESLPASSASPCPKASIPAAGSPAAGGASAAPAQQDAADQAPAAPVPPAPHPVRPLGRGLASAGRSQSTGDGVPQIIERTSDEDVSMGNGVSAGASSPVSDVPAPAASAAAAGAQQPAAPRADTNAAACEQNVPGRRRLTEVPAASAFSRYDSRSGSSGRPSLVSHRASMETQRSWVQSPAGPPDDPGGMQQLSLSNPQAPSTAGHRAADGNVSAELTTGYSHQVPAVSDNQYRSPGVNRAAAQPSRDNTPTLDVNADGEPMLAAQDLASGHAALDVPRMFRHGSTGATARQSVSLNSKSAPAAAAAAAAAGGRPSSTMRSSSAASQHSPQHRRANSLVQPSQARPSESPVTQRSPSQAEARPEAAAAALPPSGKPQLDAQLAGLAAPDSCVIDLDLQWEAIGPQGAAAVAAAIALAPSLQRLNLEGNSLSIGGAGAVLDALPACSSLQELVLSNNSLGTGVLTNLATVLVRCGALQRLSLSNVNAQTQGVSSLCQALLRPTCGLVFLDLASNALQPEAGTMLAEVIRSKDTRLESILLQNNQLGEAGCLALVNAATAQERPCSLNLSNNGLPLASTRRLRTTLRRSPSAAAIQL